jgi:hypothetical protein
VLGSGVWRWCCGILSVICRAHSPTVFDCLVSGVAKAKSVDKKRYHLECFKCDKCSTTLHSQFLPQNGQLFCIGCGMAGAK